MIPTSNHPSKPLSVLLIEDNSGDARLLEEALREGEVPVQLRWERDLATGLRAAEEEAPDILLVDLGLPDCQGVATVRRCLEASETRPVVVLTGAGDLELALAALEAGAADFLEKDELTPRLLARTVWWSVERHRQERRLQRSEERYRALSENASDGIVTISADGRIVYANPATEKIFGYDRDALVGARLVTLIPRELREHHEAGLARYLETGERSIPWDGVEFPAVRKDDDRTMVEVSFGEYEVAGERYFTGMIRDISDRVEAERKLRESEERFRQMAEAIVEVFYLWDYEVDPPELLYVSPAYGEIWGRDVADLYADPMAWGDAIVEEDQEVVEAKMAVQDRTSVDVEYRIRRPDGELRWIEDRAFPVRDEVGAVVRVAGVARDITEQRQAHQESEEQKRRLARILDTTAEGVLLADSEGDFLYANPAAQSMLGLPEEEIRSRSYADPAWSVFGPNGGPFPAESLPVAQVLRHGSPVMGVEHGVARPDGSHVILSVNAAPLNDPDGELTGVVASIRDVTDRKQFEAQLEHRALHDYLTGLPNRALFQDRLEHALERVRRTGDLLAVLFLDMKRFKVLNDSLGHDAGDRVLQEMSGRLRTVVRDPDTVARIGGDEFTVLLEDVEGQEDAVQVAERIAAAVTRPIEVGDREISIDVSIGVAVHGSSEGDETGVSDLIRRADQAMYRAKSQPGTGYAVARPPEDVAVPARIEQETRLREALDANAVHTVYQPIFDVSSGELRGVEALARWNDPVLGEVTPDVFIPLAEETGLIVRLGEQQLEASCRQLQQEPFLHPDTGEVLRLHVNLSSRQLQDPDVVDRVGRILDVTGFPPSRLCLEITESAAMQKPDVADHLKSLGVLLAVDDFGTRYSTLAQLRRLELDAVKIDRTFVSGLPGNEKDRAIVETIVTLGRALKLRVVAEGIETEEQRKLLARLRCEEGQGYLLGRPQPVEDLRDLLARGGRASGGG